MKRIIQALTQKIKAVMSGRYFKRFKRAALLTLMLLIGMLIGINNNPKYLAWSEQQEEIKAQVDEQAREIQAESNEKLAQASKLANENADKRADKAEANAKKSAEEAKKNLKPEVKTVEKVVEKKVQYVHPDCETLISRYNYSLKIIETEVEAGNSVGAKSSISIAHDNDMQKMAKNCLNNQSYAPRGVIGGRANQLLWSNWQ